MYDTDPNRPVVPRVGDSADSPYAGYAAAGLFIAMIVLLTMAIWPTETTGPSLTQNSPQVERPTTPTTPPANKPVAPTPPTPQ